MPPWFVYAPMVVPIALHFILVENYPKIFWGGAAVGVVVGVIMALVRDNWWIVLISYGVGSWVGLGAEWVYGLIDRRRFERRLRK